MYGTAAYLTLPIFLLALMALAVLIDVELDRDNYAAHVRVGPWMLTFWMICPHTKPAPLYVGKVHAPDGDIVNCLQVRLGKSQKYDDWRLLVVLASK